MSYPKFIRLFLKNVRNYPNNILFEGVNDKITYKEFYNLCLNFKIIFSSKVEKDSCCMHTRV